ncbi:nucleic acid-binding protein [Anaeromyces robustus]|uniref:Nucleic acid-binding protein n=1 Tax=Anaeromyces robustus TaxID=1754192 RepID=A0A1Y1XJ37_9FUNG|nr:nucleic acid-binding protein [Anaeromyces robustus]|eukprot:ORX85713.1 nucleic acid-binding protein [Anaeromyces robustus]
MRRKRITNNILNEMPELKEGQVIMRSLGPKGKNIHEAELPDGTSTLVTLPPKFRNLVWIKRGNYIIVQPSTERKNKLYGDIEFILFPEHIKHLKSLGKWPEEFNTPLNRNNEKKNEDEDSEENLPKNNNRHYYDSSDEDSDDDLFVNTNRVVYESSSEEESD